MEKKRLLLAFIIGISLINSVSAYVSGFFMGLDDSTMVVASLFAIFFLVIFFAVSKVFKNRTTGEPNRAVSAGIAFPAAFLIIQGLNKVGFNIEDFFFDIGISTDFLYIIAPTIILLGAILLFWKLKSWGFILLGIFFLLIAFFTDWVYEEGILMGIGGAFVLIGLVWKFKKKPKLNDYSGYPYSKRRSSWFKRRKKIKRPGRFRNYMEGKLNKYGDYRQKKYDDRKQRKKERKAQEKADEPRKQKVKEEALENLKQEKQKRQEQLKQERDEIDQKKLRKKQEKEEKKRIQQQIKEDEARKQKIAEKIKQGKK